MTSSATANESTKRVPREALCCTMGELRFADVEGSDDRVRIAMFARSGEPISHWYWGRIVHDMKGMKLRKERTPIDWCHDYDTLIGFLDTFDAKPEGLNVSGELVKFKDDDRAAEVIFKGRAGIPYEASIDWSGPGTRIEEIGEGVQVQVNGYTFTGPGYVVREWPLRAVAVCPYGADPKTRSEFSDEEPRDFEVTLFSEPNAMTKTASKPADPAPQTPPAAATQQTENPAGPSPAPAPSVLPTQHSAGGDPPQPPKEPTERDKFQAELDRYTKAFGANGLGWFREGKSFDESLTLHAEALNKQAAADREQFAAQLAEKDKEIAALKEKLAAIPRGANDPVGFSDGEGQQGQGKLQAGISNRIKIASAIKIPGRQ